MLICTNKYHKMTLPESESGRHDSVNKEQWPPKSPDLNPFDYYIWDEHKEKVYEQRTEPLNLVKQLKRRGLEVGD